VVHSTYAIAASLPMVLWKFLYTTFYNSCIIHILVCVLLGLTTNLLTTHPPTHHSPVKRDAMAVLYQILYFA